MSLQALLEELERLGEENDAEVNEHERKYLNITRDTGEFLAVLLKATRAESVLEIGTSNGYSTLWLASAIGEGGRIVTVEASPDKSREAQHHFMRSGLADRIHQVEARASDFMEDQESTFDLIFLDADRREYMAFAERVIAALNPTGVLVCDNAVSHREELAEFMEYIERRSDFTTCLVPVGKGEFVACKTPH